jgi:hypothetical protein
MEADWEAEIGNGAPVIDACWLGFVDLSMAPDQAAQLPEARELPALAAALVRLNAPLSPVWTAKCDLWYPEQFDPDELDAPAEAGKYAIACYVDLLLRNDEQWATPEHAIATCKALCSFLHMITLRCSRADLVMRRALISPARQDLGITAYLTACGSTHAEAAPTLASALRIFADAVLHHDCPPDAGSKLQ